jgi:putative phosphoesterase
MAPPASILVLSDTHGDTGRLKRVLDRFMPKADALVHLGDGVDDLMRLRMSGIGVIPWEAVRGNGDRSTALPFFKVLEIRGKRIMICHGHLMGVAEGPEGIVEAARSAKADAVLYGHTHRARWEEYGGILALCPGSLGRPRDGRDGSFAVLEADEAAWFGISFYRLADSGSISRYYP